MNAQLNGLIVTKESPNYETCCLSWNRAIDKHPSMIIYCQQTEDVVFAIHYVREKRLPFRVRSGTHHYAGYSTGDGVVVIDVSRMDKIVLTDQSVTVQGGVRNRELYEKVCQAGYAFAGGGCPTVGVAGYTLGGGWGYSSRLLGLGCDSLIEAEIVIASGEVLTVNQKQHAELFFALRGGGGGNFGVVTSLTYRLSQKRAIATLINIDYPHQDFEKVAEVALIYQTLFHGLDRRMNLKMAMYHSNGKGRGVKLTGLFYGQKEEAAMLLSEFSSAPLFEVREMSVLEANREIQDSHPDFEMYCSGGRFVMRDYTRDEFINMLNLMEERAQGSVYTALTLYGLGGAISDILGSATAFYYRDARFILGFQSVFEDRKYKEENILFVQERFSKLRTYTKGSFINFPIEQGENYEKEYYGDNLARLQRVKRTYDSDHLFNFEQSIRG